MVKRFICVFLLTSSAAATFAQEFWMQPDKFFLSVKDTMKVEFSIGHDFIGTPWNLEGEKVKALKLHHKNAAVDYKALVKEGRVNHLNAYFEKQGTYVLSMQSNPASITVDANNFNAYLKENGLEDAYNYRQRNNTLQQEGKEVYERNTKLVVQVGDVRDDSFKKNTGLPLEIIPLDNPYTAKVGDVIRFKVLFNNKPLFGARAFVWNNKDGRTYRQPLYTLQDGTIEARIFNDGPWMINVIKMVKASPNDKADWKSYWGSLVFGVR